MKWFRLWTDIIDDIKMLQLTAQEFRIFILIMAVASENDKNGVVPFTVKQFAWRIRTRISLVKTALIKMQALLLIEYDENSIRVVNWEKRQFTTEYKQQERHREKRQELGLSRRAWINPKVREFVMNRDNSACVYCNSELNLTLDHIIPEIKNGDSSAENLVVACRFCNAKKREFTIQQAGLSYRNGYIPPPGCKRQASLKQGATKPQASTDTDTDTDTDKPPIPPKIEPPKKKKEPKKKPTPLPDGFSISGRVREWAAQKNTGHLEEHLENFISSCQAKGYEYLDWDAAFMNAIRQNWAKIGGNGNVGIRTSRSDPLDKNLQSRTDAEVSAALAKYEATKKSSGNNPGRASQNDDAPNFQE